jgi:hypothetical protein
VSPKFKVFLYKTFFNLWPCIRGTGARVVEISPDFHSMRVKIPLNWRTRNRVGTIFGGSIYGAVDPFYMLMFMEILGKDFIVWDKGAEIKFIKPGISTLHADFKITPEMLNDVKTKVLQNGSYVFDILAPIQDAKGIVHAEVKKIMYVATKAYYLQRHPKKVTN